MIQKKEGEVEFLWRESDYDQKTHLEKKKYSVFLKCSISSASRTNSKKNKLERGEAGGKEKKPDYLDILKKMQIFISFLDKVKPERYFALIQYVSLRNYGTSHHVSTGWMHLPSWRIRVSASPEALFFCKTQRYRKEIIIAIFQIMQ